jgi:thioesterase domain-containing protein
MTGMDRPDGTTQRLAPTLFPLSGPAAGGSLVFCPDVGGNVVYARPLLPWLSPQVRCIGAHLLPQWLEQPGGIDIAKLGARFAADIRDAGLAPPIHLIGFSFAGIVAFETARHLSRLGVEVAQLWIVDTHIHRKFVLQHFWRGVHHELRYAARYLKQNRRRFLMLPPDPDVLHQYGQSRFDLNKHPQAYRTVIRLMYDALARYRPQPWSGPATVLRARGANHWDHMPDDLGWARLIRGELHAIPLQADHLGLLRSAGPVKQVADIMLSRLQSPPTTA